MWKQQMYRRRRQAVYSRAEGGMALVTALFGVLILAVVGAAVVTVTTQASQISGNYKASIQAFEAAQAGSEEMRARLQGTASRSIAIVDQASTSPSWEVYAGAQEQATAYGYTGASGQTLIASAGQSSYTAIVKHAMGLNPVTQQPTVLYWGDASGTGVNTKNTVSGENVYVVTSHGLVGGAHRIVQTTLVRVPPIPIPGMLYVEAPTSVLGSSTNILGADQCGDDDKPGIWTPNNATYVDNHGHTQDTITIAGQPTIHGTPDIKTNGRNLDIQGIVDNHKEGADFKYAYASNTTRTGTAVPGPGDQWGQPQLRHAGDNLQQARTCDTHSIVYYDMANTELTLSGGVSGCGVLLVHGDLNVHGDFAWYGAIVVTGSVIYTGGGNRNVTGAMLSGGSVDADVIGGNTNIVWCSDAAKAQPQKRPLTVLNWNAP